MKLRQYAITVATLSLFSTTFARPSPQPDPFVEEGVLAKRDADAARTNPKSKNRDTKYFHEPGGNDELGHYDIRYFRGSVVTYEEKSETLHYMIRAYLTTFRELGIETWIAHGTLLGWWWNGKIMPWDWDLDTQVASSTLDYLGEHYNRTLHNWTDTSIFDGSEVNRTYLLDINPNSKERVRGDGQNVIDARWIDISTGLFIDITGLAEIKPDQQPGVWSCKNYHRYRTTQLYPMRETTFQGVRAQVPYAYEDILVEEYRTKALVKTQHEGHTWNAEQKEWIKDNKPQPNPYPHVATRGLTPGADQVKRD